MTALQLRYILEAILGYYSFVKEGSSFRREPRPDAPGWYYQQRKKIGPAIFLQGTQRVPSNWDVQGLETILVEGPVPKVSHHVGLTERTQLWTVYLQYFGNDKPVKEYVFDILRHFGKEAVATYYRKNDTDLSDRAMINITTIDFDLQNWPTGSEYQYIPSPIDGNTSFPFIDR